jgi:hypothetical protein
MQIFQGILGIIIGFLLIKYAYPVKQFTGPMSWAEKIFGMGGTSTAIKVIGILMVILSFLWMTGTLADVLRYWLSPYLGGSKASS